MGHDIATLEGEADSLLGDDEVPGARRVVERWLGPDAVILAPFQRAPAMLVEEAGRYLIKVRPGLSSAELRWCLLHEVAEWHSRGHVSHWIEEECEQLTACLAVPRRAFRRAIREAGRDWPELARRFVVSETCVALRYGEVFDIPVAVHSPASVDRVRGPERGWHREETIRRLARAKALPMGLHRERLRDDERRVLLTEEAIEDE